MSAPAGVLGRDIRQHQDEAPACGAPFGLVENHAFLAGMRCHELSVAWIMVGPITRLAFKTDIGTQLAPTPCEGDVVILDISGRSRERQGRAVSEAKGSLFLFPPAYGPGSNPIEQALAKIKAHLRKAEACTFDVLWRALNRICNLFKPQEY